MSEQDSVLLLRRIEQAIYGLEKRMANWNTPTPSERPSAHPTEPLVVQFPSVMSVEIEGGMVSAVIEEQPIQTETVLTRQLSIYPVDINLGAAGTAPIITAPSDASYAIYGVILTNNGTAVARVRLQSSDSIPTVYTGFVNLAVGSTWSVQHIYPFLVVSAGASLMVRAETAAELGGCVLYQAIL
jgi:hypothetical protein